MFRIVGFESTPDGKTRFTVETDDSTTGLFLRFFTQADKFAQLLHYRLTTESRLDASQKSVPEKMARMQMSRAQLLTTFREIRGTPSQRINILQEMCIGNGTHVTQDRLFAQLQLAREEETEDKIASVKRLIRKGKTLGQIAAALDIPKSTVARLSRLPRGARKRDARVKRSVLALAGRSPGISPPPPPGRRAPIPPGRPKTA